MRFYRTVTVYFLPERQLEGIQKLKELAHLMDEYDVPTELLSSFASETFCVHVVSRFETSSQFEAVNAWATTSNRYQQWLQSVQDLFDWSQTQTNLYTILV